MPASKADTTPEMLQKRLEFGRRLESLMKMRGFKRSELAMAVESDKDHIGRLIRGVAWPGAALLIRLGEALRGDIDWLLTGRGKEPTADPDVDAGRAVTGRRPFELVRGGRDTMSKMPDAVVQFLAFEGSELKPELVDKLKRFDYTKVQARLLTLEAVRRLATLLDSDEPGDDDS
jgi:transcriptional regulator with XRE-family HTH domain